MALDRKQLTVDQHSAVNAKHNIIVAAGAGSGKTSVLSQRFAHLVLDDTTDGKDPLRVDEILTLTFTNKSTNEMYERIYKTLSAEKRNEDPAKAARAERALDDFYKAKIKTIDAFCADVARTGSLFFGIPSDFQSNEDAVTTLADKASLSFVLDNRANKYLRALIAERKIQNVADELFARTVLQYCTVSSPLDFNKIFNFQLTLLLAAWKTALPRFDRLLGEIKDALAELTEIIKCPAKDKKQAESFAKLKDGEKYIEFKYLMSEGACPDTPDINKLIEQSTGEDRRQFFRAISDSGEERQKLVSYIGFAAKVAAAGQISRLKIAAQVSSLNLEARDIFDKTLGPAANYFLQLETISGMFELLHKFQDNFNRKKRLAGLLTFNDIARLAVDTLIHYPEIRALYKQQIKSIMIDEFQDNNELQRDLIFLIAEDGAKHKAGIPGRNNLSKEKMFFVGDEKQSIYRFRGADVSVFHSLSAELPDTGEEGNVVKLLANFRSKQSLINAFNVIFENVFKPIDEDKSDYEADFEALDCGRNTIPGTPADIKFCLLQETEDLAEKKGGVDVYDAESAFIAKTIRGMVDSGHKVLRNQNGIDAEDACNYNDFAILLRKKKFIRRLEKQFKAFGIPYTTEDPAAIWQESVVSDILAILRCLVYRDDKLSFAVLLRSPFVRLNDNNFASCMLHWNKKVFDPALLEFIEGDDEGARYGNAVENFTSLRAEKNNPVTDIITKIWYYYGYRFETVKTEAAQKYSEIYDYIFEVARRSDEAGKNLAEFIDEIEYKRQGGRDDLEIPVERSGGVSIMTIHKSKGLQFPVVFIPFCGAPARERNENGIIYYKKIKESALEEFELRAVRGMDAVNGEAEKETGKTYELLFLNLPAAPELQTGGINNYFYRRFKYDNAKMAQAEIKRLLYVAGTRAESTLYWTAAMPLLTKEEEKNTGYDDMGDSIEKRLLLFRDKTLKKRMPDKKNDSVPMPNFLELLVEPLAESIISNKKFMTVEEIKDNSKEKIEAVCALYRNNAALSLKKTLFAAKEMYANAETEKEPEIFIEYKNASAAGIQEYTEHPVEYSDDEHGGEDTLTLLLKRAGLSNAYFGEAAHTIIENKLNGIDVRQNTILDGALLAEAEKMADFFLSSELGKQCLAAEWRETEYPFMSLVTEDGRDEDSLYPLKKTFISGRMDLVFKHDKIIYIVDFKTDRIINPLQHESQLKYYREALTNLYPADRGNIKTYLFYLRHGKEILCS
jgi:ATP-dependent helicase/nuclease subunit A